MHYMRIRILALASIFLIFAGSCAKWNEMDARLDLLDSRVSALENQIEALNQNVAATAGLMSSGTIRSAVEQDGVWTITLNNGEIIRIIQGRDAEALIPVMTIDSEGYWMIDFGSGASYVLYNGQKVRAFGADGITPVFSVNNAGNWTVSYDGGKTFTEVPGPDGKPVSAIPEGGTPAQDPYFKSVSYEDGALVVVLKDNTTLRIPIVADFYCIISGSDQLQQFRSGETRQFRVSMSKVVQTFVTVPAGWEAVLSGNSLAVTAPATTKANLASTATDVSILALSAAGAAALAKLRVSLGDSPTPGPDEPGGDDEPTDYYEAWQRGEDIQIAGVYYNKAQYGDGILLVADAPAKDLKAEIHQKSGVFFLEAETPGEDYFDLSAAAEIVENVVLVGRYAGKKVLVKPSESSHFKLRSGMLVMKNLEWDMSGSNRYLCNNNAGAATVTFTRWHMDDCRFVKLANPMLYAGLFTTGIESLIVRNCFFELTASGNLQIFNFSNSSALHTYKELVFSNNEVYSASPVSIQVFQYNQYITQDTSQNWDTTMKADNNLFYNCPAPNGYFKFYQLSSLSMTRNLFWADSSFDSVSYGFILYGGGQSASAVTAANNIAYGLAPQRNWLSAHMESKVVPDPNVISKTHEDPIAAYKPGESLTLLEPYREYGPQR